MGYRFIILLEMGQKVQATLNETIRVRGYNVYIV